MSSAETAVQIGRALWTTVGPGDLQVTRQAITAWGKRNGWTLASTGPAGQMWDLGMARNIAIQWELDDVARRGVLDRIAWFTGRNASDIAVEIALRQRRVNG